MKLTKELIEKVRSIDGFPIGTDEDIIELSQSPYYTACPNPFVDDFIIKHGKPYDEATDDYHREPFAADVSEGKNDPIYNAHSYHTKVPYKAIMKYILHYTEPGDIVLDGFAGSGMTGVAAQMCEWADDETKLKFSNEMSYIKWGARKAILNDLSPIATLISSNYNLGESTDKTEVLMKKILEKSFEKHGWMYQTKHRQREKSQKQVENSQLSILDTDSIEETKYGTINYTIFSDVLICPHCGNDIVLWDVALDKDENVNELFNCSNCSSELKKQECDFSVETYYDSLIEKIVKVKKIVPVQINYYYNGKRFEKIPDEFDLEILDKINEYKVDAFVPILRMCKGRESRRNDKFGIEYIHQFYTKRNLIILSEIFANCLTNQSKFVFTACAIMGTKMSRFGKRTGNVSGTLYIPSLIKELNMFEYIDRKLYGAKGIIQPLRTISQFKNDVIISTGSTTDLSNVPANSIDYIFTDPPFGDNLNYSELSFIWEGWLKIITNNKFESIINRSVGKSLLDYQRMMTQGLTEYYRVIKPNRWITIEFHNSKNSVWMAIQEAIQKSGFIIADVRILDKMQGSFKQVNSSAAVKQDLVISAYKPKESFQREFISHQGTVQTAWDFVRQHLEKLPVVVAKNKKIEVVVERQAFLLFDRMIAYHIVNGILVPLDAADFYKGLDEKFIKRDGMYFLHDQVNEYDNARIKTDVEDIQFSLFVSNEKTAIAWLYQQLITPQTYADIQPKFMQEIRSIEKHEELPELSSLLEDNFLKDDSGKWYIPDTNKAVDVMRLREKKLVKEFEEYLNTPGKLKKFRTEAVRAGFAKLWKDRNYDLIVKTAERLPEEVVQEDDKILMYYDISLSRLG